MAKNKLKMNKFLTGAVTATMVATAVVPMASADVAAAKEFSDVPATDAHYQNIMQAVERGLFNGYADGTFKPYRDLSRGNVAKVLANYVVSQDGSADYAAYIEKHDLATNVKAFSDVSSTHSDKELFNASLIVKDAKIFDGSNNNLMPTKTISRQQMAKVLVKGFGLQDLPGDLSKVTDNSTAFAEFVPYINILSENGVTTETSFKPGSKVKRAQMASFLNRSFDIAKGALAPSVKSVKAINATTVEVTMKEKAENIGTFTIEGLTVSNAAVKQSDDKVVVLTTAVQEGGKKYTVKLAGDTIGTFDGVSAVIPTKIDITTQSVQGKVGAQATISADVGIKQAGIPVTFNVKANTTGTLNKDQVFESVTDANGIATFSYTQYAAGTDSVVAYPTGAPTVRSLGYVFWGVDTILTVVAQDEKGNSVSNGEDKTYTLTYLDPKNGKPVANKKFYVTFDENIDVNIDKTSEATVNGVNPRQLLNNEAPIVAEVTTDAKGQAVFTVSGKNTAVTPVVFEAIGTTNVTTYEADKLQAKADKVTFAAIQAEYTIEVTRDGKEEAAKGLLNGREYKVVVKAKDGKIAANELVNIAFNEDIDRNINTNTNANFIKFDAAGNEYYAGEQVEVKTNAKGEATFMIGSEDNKDYATPVAWIDINTPNAKEGNLDDGETSKIAAITYFADEKLTDGVVLAYDAIGEVPRTSKKEFAGNEVATFKFTAANQSSKSMNLPAGYSGISATFTVFNTGADNVKVNGQIVSPNRSYTTPTITGVVPSITVESVDNKTTSVRVVANGTATPFTNSTDLRPINLGSHTTEAQFVSTKVVGTEYVGIVTGFNTNTKKITFAGKLAVSYAGKVVTFSDERTSAVKTLTEKEFSDLVNTPSMYASAKLLINGDNYKFVLTDLDVKPANLTAPTAQAIDTNADGKADSVELTFAQAVNTDALSTGNFTFAGGTVTATNVESVTGNAAKVKITISGAINLTVPGLTYTDVAYLGVNGADLTGSTISVSAASIAQITVATAAVEIAEANKTQGNVDAAKSLVTALPTSSAKTALQNRLNAVQATIDATAIATAIQQATVAVEDAETTKTQAKVNTAQGLVTGLPTSANASKAALQARIDAVQAEIVTAIAAGVSSTLTATGAANDVILPVVTAGNTIAVKNTSAPTVYTADGKILTTGTSNVVYTVTNTASGKTADTAVVAVAVTVTP